MTQKLWKLKSKYLTMINILLLIILIHFGVQNLMLDQSKQNQEQLMIEQRAEQQIIFEQS